MQLQHVTKEIIVATAMWVAMPGSNESSRAYNSNVVVPRIAVPHRSTIRWSACTRWPLKCLDGRQVVNRARAKQIRN